MAVSALVALGASAATAATIVSVMTTIGTVMTVVGVVTGNKDLMKIGSIIGIVGAVGTLGSMASGAASASATPLAEAASTVATEAVNPAVQSISNTALDVSLPSAPDLNVVSSGIPIQPNLIPTALPPLDSAAQAVSATPVLDANYGFDPVASTPLEMTAPNTAAPVVAQDAVIPQSEVNTIAPSDVQMQAPQAAQATQAPQATQDPTTSNSYGVRINNPSAFTAAGPIPNSANQFVDKVSGNFNGMGERINNPSAYTPPGSSAAPNSANKFFDKISGMWNGMGERGKSQLIGAGASMFSGAQNASAKEKELALQQQRINQTSYGSSVPRLSIINKR